METPPPPSSSYGQIIKSTGLIGGSSLVSVLVSMIRVKFTAVYLGPLGVGLFGAYTTILAPIIAVSGFGLGASGVRQIAEATGSGDQVKVARTILTVKRAALVSGLIGAFLVLVLAYPACHATFGNTDHVIPLAVLSLTLLVGGYAAGLGGVLQGLRRVRDMAAQSIIGAVLGLPIAIPMLLLWGIDSIVPMMVASSALGLLITWWYARRIRLPETCMTWRESWQEAVPMLKLGFVFMSIALIGGGVAYLTRVIIIRKLGVEANGLFSAAYMVSGYYVGLIIAAMNIDFIPRLAAVARNNTEINRLVNEQIQVGILLALPGIVATLLLAPLVIRVFYTDKFYPAIELMQWLVLGIAFRVVAWPMGTVPGIKSAKRLMLWVESASNALQVLYMFLGVFFFGLVGSGIALFVFSLGSVLTGYLVIRHLTGFTWSAANLRLISTMVGLLVVAFLAARLLPWLWGAVFGVVLASATGVYSLHTLNQLLGRNLLLAAWGKVKGVLGAEKPAG